MDDAREKNLQEIRAYEQKYGQPFLSTLIQMPEELDIDECKRSTMEFVILRNGFDHKGPKGHIEEYRKNFPLLFEFADTYPLPIGFFSILINVFNRSIFKPPKQPFPNPLLESKKVQFVGLTKRFTNDDTIGWFIGMLEDEHFELAVKLLEDEDFDYSENSYLQHTHRFKFIEGVILLEGRLDDKVISDLKEYEKYYNKNILGKVITGRPPDDPEYWLYLFGKVVKSYPGITQRELAMRVHCHEKTIRYNLKKADFPNFKAFKKSILEQ